MVKRMLRLGAALTFLLLLTAVLLLSDSRESDILFRAEGDLDKDGITEEYVLTDHVLTIKEGTQKIWTSPQDYRIDNFALGDVNNDGNVNMVISLWKKGSFGKFKPFWHTEENMEYMNHLYVYKLQDNTFKPVWFSSNLDRPILSFAIRDIDGDNLNELVVEEGQYKKVAEQRYDFDPNGAVRTTCWKWTEWGFSLYDAEKDS